MCQALAKRLAHNFTAAGLLPSDNLLDGLGELVERQRARDEFRLAACPSAAAFTMKNAGVPRTPSAAPSF